MESLNCSKGNTVGIVVAYFLIYVVWLNHLVFKAFRPFSLTIEKTASFYAPYICRRKCC